MRTLKKSLTSLLPTLTLQKILMIYEVQRLVENNPTVSNHLKSKMHKIFTGFYPFKCDDCCFCLFYVIHTFDKSFDNDCRLTENLFF